MRPAQPEDEEHCSTLLRAIWAEGEAFLAHPDEAPDRVLAPVDPTGPAAFVAEVRLICCEVRITLANHAAEIAALVTSIAIQRGESNVNLVGG